MEQKQFYIEQLKTFSEDAAEGIRKLVKQLGNNYQELADEDIKSMLGSACTFLFIAKRTSDQQIVGMVTLLIHRIPYVKKSTLEDLIVDEAFRGHGLGGLLFEKALEVAKEQKAAYVDFTSRPRRLAGNNLYEKFGFEKRETNVYRRIFDYAEI